MRDTFTVRWSDEDAEWVATSACWSPGLSGLGATATEALGELLVAIAAVEAAPLDCVHGRVFGAPCPHCLGVE